MLPILIWFLKTKCLRVDAQGSPTGQFPELNADQALRCLIEDSLVPAKVKANLTSWFCPVTKITRRLYPLPKIAPGTQNGLCQPTPKHMRSKTTCSAIKVNRLLSITVTVIVVQADRIAHRRPIFIVPC